MLYLCCGSWNWLLNTLFPPDTIFEVVPQFPAVTVREAVDFVILLLIYVNSTHVFVVEVKPPSDFRFILKRQEADLQLQKRFLDISPDMKIPVLRIGFWHQDRVLHLRLSNWTLGTREHCH